MDPKLHENRGKVIIDTIRRFYRQNSRLTFYKFIQKTHHVRDSSRSVYFTSRSVACVMASILSIMLEKLDVEPAISTGPFGTIFIDIVGVANYCFIATTLLPA